MSKQVNEKQIVESLEMIGRLAELSVQCAQTGQLSELQKAIVGMIRGSEIVFEELTGVKYHQDPEDTIPN